MRLKMRLEGDDSTETDKRYQNLLLQFVSLWCDIFTLDVLKHGLSEFRAQ